MANQILSEHYVICVLGIKTDAILFKNKDIEKVKNIFNNEINKNIGGFKIESNKYLTNTPNSIEKNINTVKRSIIPPLKREIISAMFKGNFWEGILFYDVIITLFSADEMGGGIRLKN
jgi:hypothetical protein